MKQIINAKYLSTFIFLLSIMVFIKLLWVLTSLFFLPSTGEEYQKSSTAKKLYYRVRLTNEAKAIAPIKTIKPKNNKVTSMRGYKLLGLYNSKETLVVTVAQGNKSSILSKGEKVNGFELISAGNNFAIFKKNAEEFKLALESTKSSKGSPVATKSISRASAIKTQSSNSIVEEDGVKRIPKTLLTSYTKDMDKIWKDIGIAQYKNNGRADGFKVNFVKKGSDIEKLGLKRGDILKAVNSEALNLGSAMGFFNNINDLENLTLTVERNGKSEDLEYEIQ
ncbi:MAG: General secretion pathway protein C [uncultured Sulfurovum sp.]|uniref:General secretion pathway protein C n=1 Tax=uncultured Sulfurovum sp. TaxID=269237 RepID=A0A6S6TG40_9BACT|nr:MAG: General secretion pathway protein C [uncultured Sulfurovum sp.]